MLINSVHLGLTLRVCLTICGSLRDKVGTYPLKQCKCVQIYYDIHKRYQSIMQRYIHDILSHI